MGELHLEIIVDRLLREFKVDANVGQPQVAYRETIRKTVEQERQVHPPDRRPRPVRPRRAARRAAAARRRASSSSTTPRAASIPREYIPAVEKGITRGARGRRAGRLSDGRRQGRRCSTARTTRSTRPRWRSRSPARWRFKDGAAQGAAGAARADHGGRGRDARGVHGRRDRQPVEPPRPDPGHRSRAAARR